MPDLPVLVVGDVHGDLERLFSGLQPYPPDQWHTIFLGDLVDGGAFGVGALRYARDRPNTTVVLGNHEVAMLSALDDPANLSSWVLIGGQAHDLEELKKHPDLVDWMRNLPALVKLPDGTLLQHSDHDGYAQLIDPAAEDVAIAVNASVRRLLRTTDGQARVWEAMSPGAIFRRQPRRLERWLEMTNARRVVHGHFPHTRDHPDAYHGGRAINYDGRLSRFYGSARYRRMSPTSAAIAPLPRLRDTSP